MAVSDVKGSHLTADYEFKNRNGVGLYQIRYGHRRSSWLRANCSPSCYKRIADGVRGSHARSVGLQLRDETPNIPILVIGHTHP